MLTKSRFMSLVSMLSLAVFLAATLISCSGSNGGTSISSTSQAASSSSAAMGAIALSDTVGTAAGLADGAIPAGYAPGKRKAVNTADIAKLDPRLKDVVDKMVAQLRKPVITDAVSKSQSLKTMNSAPLSAPAPTTSPCSAGGSYTVTDSAVVSGVTTTHDLSVSFSYCRDSLDFSELNGSITATHVLDTLNNSETSNVHANLTNIAYTDGTFTNLDGTFVLNGDFNSTNNNNASGTNFANGSFSATSPPSGTNMTAVFSFTNVHDVWTKSLGMPSSGDRTEQHTFNGSYGLSITNNATTEQIAFTVTLANLEYKDIVSLNGNEDEWLNGSVTISWSPDMSQWGCLNGTYSFTTAAGTPVQTLFPNTCPSSGTVQVNNATIEYGKPSGTQVTITVNGFSEIFADCDSLGGGMCR